MSSIPQGVHTAVCVGLAYIGTPIQSYNNQKKVVILWEVHYNNQAKITSREYNLSFYELSTLRKHLESWRSKPFTKEEMTRFKLSNILGVPCQLEIKKENNQKYVSNVYKFPKSEEKPVPKSKFIYFDISDKKTYADLKSMPLYIISRIKQTTEYQKSGLEKIKF